MTPQESLRSALDSLASHKLRSALTMLGLIFGVGAVVAMLAITAGAQKDMIASIDLLGARLGQNRSPSAQFFLELNRDDSTANNRSRIVRYSPATRSRSNCKSGLWSSIKGC